MKRSQWMFLLALLLASVWCDKSSARVLRVGAGTDAQFLVIQNAVNAAAVGDTVLIEEGRYDSFHDTIGVPGDSSIAQISKSGIVFRGMNRENVVLGPASRMTESQMYHTGFRIEEVTNIRIENLTITNVDAAVSSRGGLSVTGVRCEGTGYGVYDSSPERLLVTESQFHDLTNLCIFKGVGSAGLLVENCEFITGYGGVSTKTNPDAVIRGCTFQATSHLPVNSIVVTDGTHALIEHCTFLAAEYHYGVGIANAVGELYDNTFEPGRTAITVWDRGYLIGNRNQLQPGRWCAINIQDSSAASFHGNDILRGTAPYIRIMNYLSPAIASLDFTGNWWGTTDADSIVAHLEYTNVGPELGVDVLWQPYLAESVPSKQSSVGELKARFQRGQ